MTEQASKRGSDGACQRQDGRCVVVVGGVVVVAAVRRCLLSCGAVVAVVVVVVVVVVGCGRWLWSLVVVVGCGRWLWSLLSLWSLSLLLLSLWLSWSLVVVVVVVVVAVVVVVVVAVGCGVVLCFERHFNVCVVHCVKEEESVAMSLQHRSPPSSQVTPSRAYRGGALESGNVSLVRRDEPACL